MINKLLGEYYWEGLEEELLEIVRKHPETYLPYQEKSSYHLGQGVFQALLEDMALNEFIHNFIYYRTEFEPHRDRYHDQLLHKFETKLIVNKILSDLGSLHKKMFDLIMTQKVMKNYDEDRFFHDPSGLDYLKTEKNLEVLWRELISSRKVG